VWELDRQLEAQRQSNEQLRARNAALDAEVRDLKTGYDAIEERARSELGMIRQDEVFYQVLQPRGAAPAEQ
jgi:cell division protein FtsB